MVVNSSTEALNHKHHKLVNPPRQLKVLVASHSNNPCGFIVWEGEDLALGQQFLGKQCLWFCPTGEATKSILNVGHEIFTLPNPPTLVSSTVLDYMRYKHYKSHGGNVLSPADSS